MQQLKISQSVTVRTMTVESYLRDINSLPMVSLEEEAELASRIRMGDDDAYRRLVEANLRFVVSVAKQYQGSGLPLSDLINEGNIGLMKAAHKFDPTRGFKFISCAVWWIRQQIMQAISDQGRMVRLPLNKIGMINKINKAKSRLEQELEREPTDEELAEFVDITPEKIGETIRESAKHMSFDTPFEDDGEGTLLDVVPDRDAVQADSGTDRESLSTDLMRVMMVLNPKEREIVSLAFGIGCSEMTLEEIGDRFDLTRERVRQIKEKAIRKMARPGVRDILVQYV